MEKSVKPLTLDEVKLAFEQWRTHKTEIRIPQVLWDQVKMLSQSYQHSIIRKTLGISGSQFYEHISPAKTVSTFIEVPVNTQSKKDAKLKTKLIQKSLVDAKSRRTDGSHLSIKNLSNQDVMNLIQAFLN